METVEEPRRCFFFEYSKQFQAVSGKMSGSSRIIGILVNFK